MGRRYVPLFAYFAETRGAFRVLAADFVSAAEGTGVVHLAPAFGEDDQAVCAAAGVDGPNPVRDDGTFDDRVADFAGGTVFAANPRVAALLEARGAVFRRAVVRHAYPHCWRCDQPLLYRAIPTWFVRVSAYKDRLVAHDRAVRWVPAHVGTGRMADWLENARDWAVSRSRFWGAPVPVWRCDRCAATTVVGSRAELERLSGGALRDWQKDLRKQARLAYDDRIVVSVAGDAEVTAALREHERWLRDQCLAEAIEASPLPSPLVSASVTVAGGEAVIALARAPALQDTTRGVLQRGRQS